MGSVREVVESTLRMNERVHQTIMDYALIVAIVSLPPTMPWLQEVQLGAVVVLNLFMVRSIGRRWGFPRGQGPLARAFLVLGIFGAILSMIFAYLLVYTASLYVPLMLGWAKAAGGFALTFGIGRTANDFYLSARRIDPRRIHLAMRRRRRSKRLHAQASGHEPQPQEERR
jgi:hypothetical protein